MKHSHPTLLVLLAALLAPAAQAAAPAERKPSLFEQVIGKATGRNGYEELVLAADTLGRSKLWPIAEREEGEGKTLTFRRRMLAEKPVVQTFQLVRRGLTKPVFPPQPSDPLSFPFPVFARFRSIARLMRVQSYVLFADGRGSEALDAVRMGIKLGRAIHPDTLISGLNGLAVDGIAVSSLASRLDQLSTPDCERLYNIALEALQAPDPFPAMLAGERRFTQIWLEKLRKEPLDVESLGLDEDDTKLPDLRRQLPTTPETLARFWAEVEARVHRVFERQEAELRMPLWETTPADPEEDSSLVGRFATDLSPIFSQARLAFARGTARLRMLAVHAAVLRYRWEHDRLPAGLEELDLGELAMDPFTGKPLRYEVTGSRYRLYSVGPMVDGDENPKAVDGRLPYSIVPGDF